MAISKEERDLLSRFWESHKDLLIAAMLSIADSDAINDADREIVQKASKALKNAAERDTTRYAWDFSGAGGQNLPKGRLVLEVVTHYAQRNKPLSLEELKSIFPDSLQPGRICAVASLAEADPVNYAGHTRYYLDSPITLADGPAVVCNQWRKENIPSFISIAEKLGYSISSTG